MSNNDILEIRIENCEGSPKWIKRRLNNLAEENSCEKAEKINITVTPEGGIIKHHIWDTPNTVEIEVPENLVSWLTSWLEDGIKQNRKRTSHKKTGSDIDPIAEAYRDILNTLNNLEIEKRSQTF